MFSHPRFHKGLRIALVAALLGAVAPSVCFSEDKAAVKSAYPAVAAPAQAAAASAEKTTYTYIIGPQNLIQIKIFGDAGTNTLYRVDESGYINHALIGRIKLSGLTVEEAEKLIQEKLNGAYIINPHVTIFILEYSRFSIIGEVQRPGTYEITGQVSVIEAISMAGGFSRVADARNVKIMRKKEGTQSAISVDATRITEHGDRKSEVYIEADDVIVVGKSFF